MGFTLLELIVVLALMAVAAGLVAPNVVAWLDKAREGAWRTDLRAALRALPVTAYQRGEALVVDVDTLVARVPSLPRDLRIELAQPLRYGPTGIASAGNLRLRRPGLPEERWEIQALTGEPSVTRLY